MLHSVDRLAQLRDRFSDAFFDVFNLKDAVRGTDRAHLAAVVAAYEVARDDGGVFGGLIGLLTTLLPS